MGILSIAGLLFPFVFIYVLIARAQARRNRRKNELGERLPFWWIPPFLFMKGGVGGDKSKLSDDGSTNTNFKIGFGDGGFDEPEQEYGGSGEAGGGFPSGGMF